MPKEGYHFAKSHPFFMSLSVPRGSEVPVFDNMDSHLDEAKDVLAHVCRGIHDKVVSALNSMFGDPALQRKKIENGHKHWPYL